MASILLATGQPGSGQQIIAEPVIEILNLNIDGSGAGGTFVNISKSFDRITEVIWHLDFSGAAINWNTFASEGSALTNGINVYYNDVSLLDDANISQNDEFSHVCDEVVHYVDTQGTPNHILISSCKYDIQTQDQGLVITSTRSVGVHIQDDMTSLSTVNEFTLTVKGLSYTVNSYFENSGIYYPNVMNTVTVLHAQVGQNYNLKVNSTSITVLDWVNFTAEKDIIQIYYKVFPDNSDDVVSLWLFRGDTFLERQDLIINPVKAGFLDPYLSLIPYIVMGGAAIVCFLLVAGATDNLRRKR